MPNSPPPTPTPLPPSSPSNPNPDQEDPHILSSDQEQEDPEPEISGGPLSSPKGNPVISTTLRRGKRKKGSSKNYFSQLALTKRLNTLSQNLSLVPFVPAKDLDFNRFEVYLRKLDLWEFCKLEFDTSLRGDLIAQLLASYNAKSRGSYVNEYKIGVNRAAIGKALRLPGKKGGDFEEYPDDFISFLVEFVSSWMVLHDEVWVTPNEVVNWFGLIKDKHVEKVDWAGLVWFMVEKEVSQGSGLKNCYYASHLQQLIKEQREHLLMGQGDDVMVVDGEDGGEVKMVDVEEVESVEGQKLEVERSGEGKVVEGFGPVGDEGEGDEVEKEVEDDGKVDGEGEGEGEGGTVGDKDQKMESVESGQCVNNVEVVVGNVRTGSNDGERAENAGEHLENAVDNAENAGEHAENASERAENAGECTENAGECVENAGKLVENSDECVENDERIEKACELGERAVESADNADLRSENTDTRAESADVHTENVDEHTENVDEHIDNVDKHTENVDEHTDNVDEHTENGGEHSEDVDEHTEDVDEHAEDVDEHTEDVDEHAEDVDEHVEDVEEHTEDVDEHTEDVDQHTEDVDQHTENVDEHTENVDEHTEDVNEHTLNVDEPNENDDDHAKNSDEQVENAADARGLSMDIDMMDLGYDKGAAQGSWLLSGKNDGGRFFLQRCNMDGMNASFEDRQQDEDDDDGGDDDDGDEDMDEEDNEEDEHVEGFKIMQKGPLDGITSANLVHDYDAGHLQFAPHELGQSSLELMSSRAENNVIMGDSSMFNHFGKRPIDLEQDISHHGLNPDNKKLKFDSSVVPKAADFNTCMEQMQFWFEKAKMSLVATRDEICQQTSMNEQILSHQIAEKDNEIMQLKYKLDELHRKKQTEIHHRDRELYLMNSVIQGYRKALKQTQKEFTEFRKRHAVPDEPIYKDAGSGGVVKSIMELERERIKQEEEKKMMCRTIERTFYLHLDEYTLLWEQLDSKVLFLESRLKKASEEWESLKDHLVKRKLSVSDPNES